LAGTGLFSTIDDFARFAQMLWDNGVGNGHRILSRKAVDLMMANNLYDLPLKYRRRPSKPEPSERAPLPVDERRASSEVSLPWNSSSNGPMIRLQ
jgi:CubicO group peptidase (beta-lactamase class C family)